MSNSDNPKNGENFQKEVLAWFEKYYGSGFELEKEDSHRESGKRAQFDIVNTERYIAIECKRYA